MSEQHAYQQAYALGAHLQDVLIQIHGRLFPKFLYWIFLRRSHRDRDAWGFGIRVMPAAFGVVPLADDIRGWTDEEFAALIPRIQSVLDIAKVILALLSRAR